MSIGSETESSYLKWRSFVESKLRNFTKTFEFYNMSHDVNARIYPVPYERDGDIFKYCVSYYIGLRLHPNYSVFGG